MRDYSYLKLLRDMLSDLRARMVRIGPKEDLKQAATDLAPAFAKYQARFAGGDPWLQSWFVRYWQTDHRGAVEGEPRRSDRASKG